MTATRQPSPPAHDAPWLNAALIVLLWAAVYLPGLGRGELRLEEPHRVAPALAMLDSGNWRQPMVGGEPYFRKPPLINWLIGLSTAAHGSFSEFAARLPSVVMLLALALTTYATARTWAGTAASFGAAVVLLTIPASVDKCRLAEIESAYLALSGMAMMVWLQGWAGGRVSWGRWMMVGSLLGLAALTKGPTHLLFFYGLVLLLVARERRWPELFRWPHWVGLGCAVLLPLCWVLSVRSDLAAAQSTWSREMFTGFERAGQSIRWREMLVKPAQSILNFAPWIALGLALPAALRQAAGQPGPPAARFLRAMIWYGAATLVLLPAIPGFRPRYAMPGYATIALALAISGSAIGPGSRGLIAWNMLVRATAAAVLPLAGLAVVMNRGEAPWVVAGVAALLCAGAAWRYRGWGRSALGCWRLSALAGTGLALAAWGSALPLLTRSSPYRDSAALVRSSISHAERFFAYRPDHSPVLIYLWKPRQPVPVVLHAGALPPEPVTLLLPRIELETLRTQTPRPITVIRDIPQRGNPLILVRVDPALR
jgi:4-amino-4-deoxy-L-arabinose transferase-like glycosyltransferase